MEGYRYAYLAGDAFFLALWLVLYYFMTCSRKAMLWSSVTLMWVSPLFEWLNQDYWKPEFFLPIKIGSFVLGVESLILGFSVIGISAGIFDWRHRRGDGASEVTRVTASSYWRLVVAGLLAAIPIVALTFLAGINSVHAHIYVCAVLAVGVIWRIKWQWKLPSLVTGLFMSGTMAAFYFGYFLHFYPDIIRDWWKEEVLWGIYLGKVPLEEFLWGASNALYLGPVIRYCMDKGFEADVAAERKKALART